VNRINRRECLVRMARGATGILGGAALLQSHEVWSAGARGKRLNFVFILLDDMGWRDLACNGSEWYETPNIDRLASQGMRFTNAYAACPVCSPTRASIVFGVYPQRTGVTNFIPGSRAGRNSKLIEAPNTMQVALECVSIAEALKPAGYVCAEIGKWHLGGKGFNPVDQGFDTQFVTSGTHFKWNSIPPAKRQEGEYLADRLTDEGEKFIEANKDKPFLLYLAHFAVHIPLEAKKEMLARWQGKVKPGLAQNNPIYAAMIESVDQSVARIVKKLEELGIADRTVIFFMSDNGGLLVENRGGTPSTSNAPLRGGKGFLYEGGVREPLIVKGPGVKAGVVCETPVISMDFYPTMLELAGASRPSDYHLDGVSLVPLLRQSGRLKDRALYWHYPHYGNQGGKPGGAIRQGNWKLIEFYEDMHLELYNLKDDIGETRNLADKMMPEKARELRKRLEVWRKDVGAKMPTPNPAYDPTQPDEWGRPAETSGR